MDLSTTYLGLELSAPLMPGASPLADDLDSVRRLEDAGASAIVMRSLFEEQIVAEQRASQEAIETPAESFGEAISYFPSLADFSLRPDEYLEQIRRIKEAVTLPVIASLNGVTRGGWLDYAGLIEQAGADALELNIYYLATDPGESGSSLERRTVELAAAVKKSISIPVAVKLSPFYSSLPNLARQLDNVGVDGLVLLNRFYQPDIDIEQLEVRRTLTLSTSDELLLRLRWVGIISGKTRAYLAISGGVHTGTDAIKSVMAGAHAVQMVSALLQRGVEYLATVREEMTNWMEQHGYDSLRQMIGSMSLARSPDPAAYERANYMRILQTWRGVEKKG